MDDDDRALRRAEMEEGHHAVQILNNPLWQSIWSEFSERMVDVMTNPRSSEDSVLEARNMFLVVQKVRQEIETALTTGQLATQQLEEEHERSTARERKAQH